ncbi:MAG: hypothetical protein HN793_05260 [Rhodospirillaceae bacterium]|jgi:hypothetical protein|nr:hypothetical protein [Rhodospirillaceae bacterium]MBT5242067.1 hypothetical protein [Rhodospirillaceae bacterium]MBT5565792.1 hypothetical protein [Rhodospirillaceae bacterium]MBT6090314.1 hypothetical protein [Rhodospirillaceae bacterium]MBT6959698.1 hypothetical protein [Rhodospirillaceae bacterium]
MPKRLRIIVYGVLLVLAVYMYTLSGQRPPPTPAVERQQVTRLDPLRQSASLGVDRADLTAIFERSPFDLRFDFVPLADGRSRVIGRTEDGRTTLELVGPPEGITSANLMAALPEANPLVRLRNLNAVSLLVEVALFDWSGAPDWVSKNIDRAYSGNGVTTQASGKTVTMSRAPQTETLVVTIAGPPL